MKGFYRSPAERPPEPPKPSAIERFLTRFFARYGDALAGIGFVLAIGGLVLYAISIFKRETHP